MEIKSSFFCEACPRPAAFYSNHGKFKQSYRCDKHKPTLIKLHDEEQYGNDGDKYWVSCAQGISLAMQKEVDDDYLKAKSKS